MQLCMHFWRSARLLPLDRRAREMSIPCCWYLWRLPQGPAWRLRRMKPIVGLSFWWSTWLCGESTYWMALLRLSIVGLLRAAAPCAHRCSAAGFSLGVKAFTRRCPFWRADVACALLDDNRSCLGPAARPDVPLSESSLQGGATGSNVSYSLRVSAHPSLSKHVVSQRGQNGPD